MTRMHMGRGWLALVPLLWVGPAGAGEAPSPLAPLPLGEGKGEREAKPGAVIRVPEDKPTIQQAILAAAAGDTVLVAPGTYPGGISLRGKAVTLASRFLTTGEKKYVDETILDGGPAGGMVITVDRAASGSRIVGFTIRNGANGIFCAGQIEVLNNRVVNCRDGIHYASGGGVCRKNLIEQNSDDGIDLDESSAVVIEENVIRNNRDDGIEMRLHVYAGKEPLSVVIRNNLIEGSGEDGIQLVDHPGASNRVIRIEKNLIRNTRQAAVGFMDGGNSVEDYRAAAIPDRVYLLNNTFLDNAYGLTGSGNLVVLNNIFARTAKTALKGGADACVAYNLFWKNGADLDPATLEAPHSLRKDPLLDDEGRPGPGSPAIDAGIASFEWKEEKVLAVPPEAYHGAAPDLGAFEFRPAVLTTGTQPVRRSAE